MIQKVFFAFLLFWFCFLVLFFGFVFWFCFLVLFCFFFLFFIFYCFLFLGSQNLFLFSFLLSFLSLPFQESILLINTIISGFRIQQSKKGQWDSLTSLIDDHRDILFLKTECPGKLLLFSSLLFSSLLFFSFSFCITLPFFVFSLFFALPFLSLFFFLLSVFSLSHEFLFTGSPFPHLLEEDTPNFGLFLWIVEILFSLFSFLFSIFIFLSQGGIKEEEEELFSKESFPKEVIVPKANLFHLLTTTKEDDDDEEDKDKDDSEEVNRSRRKTFPYHNGEENTLGKCSFKKEKEVSLKDMSFGEGLFEEEEEDFEEAKDFEEREKEKEK